MVSSSKSYNLLKWHKHAHQAAVKALESGGSLSVVIRRIEKAMSSNEVPLVMPLLAQCITMDGRSKLEKERNAICHELGTRVGRNRDKFVLFEPLVVISPQGADDEVQ
ncbi:hypothetical protein CFP56_039598 [Quercus suber]|uniref:Uncharacterized protein n=1 Tax=Quercus suber TaxID=58331 RepID=A0AAW0IZ49_QUESU